MPANGDANADGYRSPVPEEFAYAGSAPLIRHGMLDIGDENRMYWEVYGNLDGFDWLYRGVARFFPEEWEQFRAGAGEDGEDPVTAYAHLMESTDASVRWEDMALSLEPNAKPNVFGSRPWPDILAVVRICSHYFAHGAWLGEGTLLRDAGRLPVFWAASFIVVWT